MTFSQDIVHTLLHMLGISSWLSLGLVRPFCHHAFHNLLTGEAAAVDHIGPNSYGKELHTEADV
jgi:hypothetical protein